MNLKTINDSINDFTYMEIIPSMEGVKILIRPYVVRDQFKIAQAQITEDYETIMKTLFDLVVEKCGLSPELQNKITLVDVQYLLKKLKMISDDESINVKVTCPHCSFEDSRTIFLKDIEIVNFENFQRTVVINDKLAIKLRVPSFKKNEKIILGNEENLEASMKSGLLNCIDSIIFENEVKNDFDLKELEEFIMGLPQKFLVEFNDFMKNEPTLKLNNTFICQGCEKEIELGIQHFFFSLV